MFRSASLHPTRLNPCSTLHATAASPLHAAMRSARHSFALALGFAAALLAGCAAPEPGPRWTATVIGPAVAPGARGTPPLVQDNSPARDPVRAPPPASAAVASNEHAEMTCAMHRKLLIAMTAEERQAVIAAHMKDMSPELRQRYLERMQNCTGRAAP